MNVEGEEQPGEWLFLLTAKILAAPAPCSCRVLLALLRCCLCSGERQHWLELDFHSGALTCGKPATAQWSLDHGIVKAGKDLMKSNCAG